MSPVQTRGADGRCRPGALSLTRQLPASTTRNAEAVASPARNAHREGMTAIHAPERTTENHDDRQTTMPPVLLACHLDSWDLGTGAIDNAAG